MSGRPVARRMNLTADSTASVPFSARSTRVRLAGETSIRRRASCDMSGFVTPWLSSLPKASSCSLAASTRSARPAPNGTDADELTRSTNTLPSRSSTSHPDLRAATNG